MKLKKQLKLAEKFLKERKMPTDKVKGDVLIRIQCEVYSASDVDMIFSLIRKGKFMKLIREMERISGKKLI